MLDCEKIGHCKRNCWFKCFGGTPKSTTTRKQFRTQYKSVYLFQSRDSFQHKSTLRNKPQILKANGNRYRLDNTGAHGSGNYMATFAILS